MMLYLVRSDEGPPGGGPGGRGTVEPGGGLTGGLKGKTAHSRPPEQSEDTLEVSHLH